MQTLSIDKKEARELYSNAPQSWKEKFEKTFGATFFKGEITDQVKTFEDACAILEIDPKGLFNQEDTKDEIAYKKLKVIIKALNEGWTPNWNDEDQYKYYPYFNMSSGGFSYVRCRSWNSFTYVGSRLCFKSFELAMYAGTQFNSEYKDFFTL
jgi:hypothetical protein